MPYTDVFNRKRYRNGGEHRRGDVAENAKQTGGEYFRADTTSRLRKIYWRWIDSTETEVEVERYFHYDELFQYFVIAGLALLLLELALANSSG